MHGSEHSQYLQRADQSAELRRPSLRKKRFTTDAPDAVEDTAIGHGFVAVAFASADEVFQRIGAAGPDISDVARHQRVFLERVGVRNGLRIDGRFRGYCERDDAEQRYGQGGCWSSHGVSFGSTGSVCRKATGKKGSGLYVGYVVGWVRSR